MKEGKKKRSKKDIHSEVVWLGPESNGGAPQDQDAETIIIILEA
jgi:hypothetical protein